MSTIHGLLTDNNYDLKFRSLTSDTINTTTVNSTTVNSTSVVATGAVSGASISATGAITADSISAATVTETGPLGIKYLKVPLSAAQLSAMSVTPVQVIPPVPGYIINIMSIVVENIYNGVAFSPVTLADGMYLRLEGPGEILYNITDAATALGTVSSKVASWAQSDINGYQWSYATTEGKGIGIEIYTQSVLGAGDSTMNLNLYYTLIPVA